MLYCRLHESLHVGVSFDFIAKGLTSLNVQRFYWQIQAHAWVFSSWSLEQRLREPFVVAVQRGIISLTIQGLVEDLLSKYNHFDVSLPSLRYEGYVRLLPLLCCSALTLKKENLE